jgi:hypothetical protein
VYLLENIKSVYKKIVSYNIKEKTQEDAFAILTNQISVITIFVSIAYTTIFYMLGNYELFYRYTPLIFVYVGVIFLNSKGYYRTAKHLYILNVYVILLLASIYNGVETGADWYYYIVPLVSLLIFLPQEKIDILISIILIIPFYILTRYLYTVFEPYQMSEIVINTLYYSVYFSLLGTLLVLIGKVRRGFF